MKILVVGRNSFLAGRFRALSALADQCVILSHEEAQAAGPRDIGSYDAIVNFALDPKYRREAYSEAHDFDLALARKAEAGRARYVMLSSRAVYAIGCAMGAREDGPAVGNDTPYGRNKAETESRVAGLLGERLTALRVANVIGEEHGHGRRTFMGFALERLKEKHEILLDISAEVRRDFLPDSVFVWVLDAVLQDPCGGPLNVGSGLPVRVGDIAGWLIEGFGTGRIVVSDQRVHDEFVLDTGRLRRRYGIACTAEEIAAHCQAIGRRLRQS